MNRRLAAHKNRKGLSVVDQTSRDATQGAVNSRAAAAAARVAARYAKAPSYSEMQAAEAMAALRAAEAATRVALEAQATAQMMLANLEVAEASMAEVRMPAQEEAVAASPAAESPAVRAWEADVATVPVVSVAGQPLEIRWEPDMPALPSGPPQTTSEHTAENFEESEETFWGSGTLSAAEQAEHAIEPVEPAQPIHANLIEFPRELVATRRVRPRVSGHQQEAGDLFGQLSIFEVDPSTISTEPAAVAVETAAPAEPWSAPEWSSIELGEEPETAAQAEPVAVARALNPASYSRRLLAGVVDGALILGTVCVAAAVYAHQMQSAPSMKSAELGAAVALLVMGSLYQALFLTLAKATPGMMYAEISLCTFEDEMPTAAQLRGRLFALLLSLLPVGLGVVWAVFDDDNLSWHDRLSQTYQRHE